MATKVLESQRYGKATDKQVDEQLKRLRNGLPPQQGFAVNFQWNPPVRRISDDYNREIDAERKIAADWEKQAEEEAAEVADILTGIELLATAPRDAGSDNVPVSTGPATNKANS